LVRAQGESVLGGRSIRGFAVQRKGSEKMRNETEVSWDVRLTLIEGGRARAEGRGGERRDWWDRMTGRRGRVRNCTGWEGIAEREAGAVRPIGSTLWWWP